MASSNKTKFMALYLTFNVVFLGFTSAQPMAQPTAQPVCPLTQQQLQVCARNLFLNILNTENTASCCALLAGVDTPLASVCACDAARVAGLGSLVNVPARLDQLLSLCEVASPPGGFNCPL